MFEQIQQIITQNPVLRQKLSAYKARQMRFVIYGTGLLAMLLLGLGVLLLLTGAYRLLMMGWVMAWIVVLGVPVMVAVIATQSTALDLQTGHYQLLYMTTLSDDNLIIGYLASVLYRARYLIGLAVGFVPLLDVGTFYMLIWMNAKVRSVSAYVTPVPPSQVAILLPAVVFSVVALVVSGTSVLTGLIGISFALHYRQLWHAIGLTIMAASVSVLTVTGAVWVALLVPQASQLVISICSPLVFIAFYGIIWEYMLNWTRKAVRTPSDE